MLIWQPTRVDKSKINLLLTAALDGGFALLPEDWYVTFGWRSRDEQSALFEVFRAGGPKAAPPGYSAHEFGLAVDVALDANAVRGGLQPNWDLNDPRWKAMIDMVRASKWLHSGIGFGDGGHIELVNWKSRRWEQA